MEASTRGLITWPLALAVLALAVLDSASGDSANGNGTGPIPPSVFIDTPEDRSMVREPSFEITGGLGGSVTSIEVFLDGESLGPARRVQDEPGRWRIPASAISLTPGLHRISAAAVGEGGRASAGIWVLFDTDLPFEIFVEPPTATYEPGEPDDDPELLLFGDDVPLDLTVTAPAGITASTNPQLTAGSFASLSVNVRTETPGEYPIVVTAVGPDGTTREATHLITITGEPPTTTTTRPPTSVGAGPGVIRDSFEGDDLWTAMTTTATNGASATVGVAGGGNPGGFREMVHTLPGTEDGENNPTRIVVEHLYTGRSWDPATDGPLARIVYSEDQIMLDPPFDGAAVGTLILVEQNGATFTAPVNDGNVFSNTQWTRVTVELTAVDFSPDPGPDVSEAGAPLTFGILRSNTSRSADEILVRHGIDNWTVELIGE